MYYKDKLRYNKEWKRWIPQRKRVYLYWFKFLQHAERSQDYFVDWKQYQGWGGSNYILGVDFNTFWKDKGKQLFSIKERNQEPKFPITTKQPKTEGIRLSLLCYEKNAKDKPYLKIAKEVYEYELGISGEKRPRYPEGEFGADKLHKDAEWYTKDGEVKKPSNVDLQKAVGRYLKRSRRILQCVCKGMFPQEVKNKSTS